MNILINTRTMDGSFLTEYISPKIINEKDDLFQE